MGHNGFMMNRVAWYYETLTHMGRPNRFDMSAAMLWPVLARNA